MANIVPPTLTRPVQARPWRGADHMLPPFVAGATEAPAWEATQATEAPEAEHALAAGTGDVAELVLEDTPAEEELVLLTDEVEYDAADALAALDEVVPVESDEESLADHVARCLTDLAERVRAEGLQSLGDVRDADELSRMLAAVVAGYTGTDMSQAH